MFSIRYTAPAKADLGEIADYLEEEAGSRIAASVIKRIRSKIKALERDGERYRVRHEIGEGRRAILIGYYLAFYRIDRETVFVLRILHSARDIRPEMIGE